MKKWIGYIGFTLLFVAIPYVSAHLEKFTDYSKQEKFVSFKSIIIPFSITYNSENWVESKKHYNESSEIEFRAKSHNDLHAIMINEDMGFSSEYMKNMILNNINECEDVKSFEMTNESELVINGLELHRFKFNVKADISDLTIIFYVYTSNDHTFQLMYLYPAKHGDRYNEIITELTNGLRRS